MPKPASTPAWNTSAANRVTPPVGIQDAGHVANEAPSSSYENWWKNLTYEWCQWVSDGTALDDATAHIVETDSDGYIHCVGLEIDANSFGVTPLLNVANATGAAAEFSSPAGIGAATVVVNGSTGAPSLLAFAGSGQPAIQAIGAGTGPGLLVAGRDSAPGARLEGANGQAGAEAESSDGGGDHGLLTITNVDAGSTVFGHYARCDAPGGAALYAEANVAGTTAGAGLLAHGGTASGSAASAMRAAVAGDGYACELLSPSTPARAPLYIRGVSADPTTLQDGDVWMRSAVGDDEGGLYLRERSATRGVHATAGGYAGFLGESRTTSSTTSTASTTKVTATFGSYAPKRAGTVRLRAVAEMEKTASSSGVLEIYDDTASVVVESRTVEFSAGQPRDIVIETNYTLPAAGARTFRLRYASAAAASGTVSIREASLRCDGVY